MSEAVAECTEAAIDAVGEVRERLREVS